MKTLLKNIIPFNNREEMSTVQYVIKKFLAFWLCYIVGLIVAETLIILLHFAMGKNMLVGDVFDAQTITLIMYYGYIIVIAITLLYWKFIEKKQLSEMGLAKHFGSYFIGVMAAVILLLVSVGIIILTGRFKYLGVFENPDISIILLFVGGFIIQGAMEELLCRGLVLHAVKEKAPLPVAVGVSTLVFILPHWSSLFSDKAIYGVIGIVNLVLISVIFSILTLYYKSIWAACGLHSLWNTILYCILGLNLSGNDDKAAAVFNIKSVGENILNGGKYGIEASVITMVVLLIFSMIIYKIYLKDSKI